MANFVLAPAAVRALTNIVRGKMSQTTPAPAPAAVSRDTFPAPFAVRWAQSENDGDGAWVIWLPDTAKLVMFAGAYVTPTGVTAAASLPAGYYTIDNLPAAATQIWLRIRPPASETAAATASFAGAADSGQDAINIQIAALATVAATGAKSVRQLVDSAITVGGGSGGGGEYTPTPAPFDFDADTGAIVNCVFYFDGNLQTLPDYTNIPTTGTVYLTALGTWDPSYGSMPWTFSLATSPVSAAANQKAVNVKLYDFSDGAVSVDWRTTFLTLDSSGGFRITAGPFPNSVDVDDTARIDAYRRNGLDLRTGVHFLNHLTWTGPTDPDHPNTLAITDGMVVVQHQGETITSGSDSYPATDMIKSAINTNLTYIECTPLSAALQSLATS